MESISFTGPARELTFAEKEYIKYVIRRLPEPDSFNSGAAFGVDTVAAYCAYDAFPDACHP